MFCVISVIYEADVYCLFHCTYVCPGVVNISFAVDCGMRAGCRDYVK